jgi:hypothetical protein
MMERILIEVKPEGLEWGVFMNEHCLGTSKSSCDADFHAHFLENLLDPLNPEDVDTDPVVVLDNHPQDRQRLLQEIEAARKTKK